MSPTLQGLGAGLADIGHLTESVNPVLGLAKTAHQIFPSVVPDLSPTDLLQKRATEAANKEGYSVRAPEDMTFSERVPYNIARFAPQVAGGIPFLANAAKGRALAVAEGAVPQTPA
jgi:hypothetical protein